MLGLQEKQRRNKRSTEIQQKLKLASLPYVLCGKAEPKVVSEACLSTQLFDIFKRNFPVVECLQALKSSNVIPAKESVD